MKRFLLIVIVGIGILVGIAFLMGSRLPRDHEVAMTTTFRAPVEQTWAAVTDVRAYPTWRGVKNVEIVTPAPLTWKEDGMTLTVDAWQPPRRLVTRMTDEGAPFGGTWTYVIEPDTVENGKTRVTITESGWVSNPVFRFASKYLMGQTSTIDTYLRALSKKFGPEVAPTRVVVTE
jgi:uncharacterized protein YndB with AHSA1/START domain